METLKVGDKVKINHNCHESYWDITGVIAEIDTSNKYDDFYFRVVFDKPIDFDLAEEYFALRELDKI